MKKIQNFTILKISSERIRNNKYNLDVSYREAIRNQEIVHISDSQLIRTIHQITNSKYNQKNYNELLSKRKYLSRKKNSKENRKELENVISEIEKLLHIEQIVSVFFSNKKHAEKMVKAASEIIAFADGQKQQLGSNVFEVRIGIHSGPVIAGIIGTQKFAYDIWGDTVNTAARMEQSGEAGKINISHSTYNLVKKKVSCLYRGKLPAKNKGEIDMYFVETIC